MRSISAAVVASNTAVLERALGHQFADRSLLELALTHRSISGSRNNERLEFLGDSVLGYVIAAELYRRFPKASEGELTRARAQLVNEAALARMAQTLALGDFVRLGPGELKSGGHRRSSILADCLEALIGAIHLDSGLPAAAECVRNWCAPLLDELRIEAVTKDPKTQLQEFLQGRGLPLPRYDVLETTGKAHAQKFRVSCTADGLPGVIEAWGDSRRVAEQIAAAAALQQLTGASS